MTDATHETAANKLKASGSQVDLMVKYNPEGKIILLHKNSLLIYVKLINK